MSKKNKEYLIIASVLLILVVSYIFVFKTNDDIDQSSPQIVEVRYKDEKIMSFDISEDATYTIDVDLGHMHIEVKDEKYRVYDVDCPDKICEKVGWVEKGDPTLIVCLPNNIVIVQV